MFSLFFPLDALIHAADVGIFQRSSFFLQLFDYYFFGSCLFDFGTQPNPLLLKFTFYLHKCDFIIYFFHFIIIEFFFFSYLNWVLRLHFWFGFFLLFSLNSDEYLCIHYSFEMNDFFRTVSEQFKIFRGSHLTQTSKAMCGKRNRIIKHET